MIMNFLIRGQVKTWADESSYAMVAPYYVVGNLIPCITISKRQQLGDYSSHATSTLHSFVRRKLVGWLKKLVPGSSDQNLLSTVPSCIGSFIEMGSKYLQT